MKSGQIDSVVGDNACIDQLRRAYDIDRRDTSADLQLRTDELVGGEADIQPQAVIVRQRLDSRVG